DAHNIMIATRQGQAITFSPTSFRSMGRGTHGVRGIRLENGDSVIGMIMPEAGQMVLTITEHGFAKRTEPAEYRVTNRGGKGVRNVQITEKTGSAVSVAAVLPDYDLMITSLQGQVIRIEVDSIRVTGRDAQGVMAIRLSEDDSVMDAVALPSIEDVEKASTESQTAFAEATEASVIGDEPDESVDTSSSSDPIPPEDSQKSS
ncbi:MAG TPA: DNA gyrase C-terminal beta-propeller domain-containing protein, partial [Fibrobacteraceae bacterium]|nr:DNA gyrase C-terminal beta-propeller domain-containing protein [Fibrobacteraceae bacterium]